MSMDRQTQYGQDGLSAYGILGTLAGTRSQIRTGHRHTKKAFHERSAHHGYLVSSNDAFSGISGSLATFIFESPKRRLNDHPPDHRRLLYC